MPALMKTVVEATWPLRRMEVEVNDTEARGR